MEVNTSPPGICTGVAPMRCITSPARPGARILSPLMSSRLLISLRNQPAIWVPLLPHGSGLMPNSPYSSSHSA